jgi:hypothetical protein
VAIPKQEVAADGGCCTVSTQAAAREAGLTPGSSADGAGHGLGAAFLATSAVLGAAALAARGGTGVLAGRAAGGILAAAGAASIPLGTAYLADVLAPSVLHLPYHRCVWCAFAAAPETIVGAALCLAGVFSLGWAWIARLVAAGDDAARPLYGVAAFCLLGVASMSAGFALTS